MFTEDQLLPISALQHWLFCPRQCALIHVEQAWAENRYTAEGRVLHERAHAEGHESRPGLRITRTLPVRSFKLGITGQCDIVEFHKNGSVVPVEYKRGKPKSHRADEVQVCAQAMCLEEMLDIRIPNAQLFYGQRKRRTEVALDDTLRDLTTNAARELHDTIAAGITPTAVREKKCDTCSLLDLCMPDALRFKRGAADWFERQLYSNP